MVDGYGHDDPVAVDEVEGYTGDISGTMGFCCKRGKDGCGENQGSEPLKGWHGGSSSAGLAEGTLGAWFYLVLMG